jgi:hypothetical protein
VHDVCEKDIEQYLHPQYGIYDYLTEQKRNGRIKHLGFSVHGNLETTKRFLEVYGKDMEFCQIQLNWLDYKFQSADAKLELLREWNIPVWVMEPLRGGSLLSLSEEHKAKLSALQPAWKALDWGFRFLQSFPEVTVTLSGMSDLAQMQENIMESCKMQEVRLALAAIRKSPYVPSDSPLLKLKYSDVKPNIKRQKTYEMSIKLQSYAVGVSHGIAPDHMIKAINFFDDPQQVIADSEPYMQRYLDSIYEPQVTESGLGDRSGLDYNNNIENSPILDGPSKIKPMKEDNPEADRTDKQFR